MADGVEEVTQNFKRLPWRFWIITLVAFINAVSFTIIIPVLYPYAKQFGLSDFEASLLTTAYAASQFIGTPHFGTALRSPRTQTLAGFEFVRHSDR